MKKIIIIFLFFIYDSIKRSSSYVVSYFSVDMNEKKVGGLKESITCLKDSDCNFEKMVELCNPGDPDLLKCTGAKYYCGDDGKCRGYNCF